MEYKNYDLTGIEDLHTMGKFYELKELFEEFEEEMAKGKKMVLTWTPFNAREQIVRVLKSKKQIWEYRKLFMPFTEGEETGM